MFVYVKNRFKGFSQKSYVFNEDGEKLLMIKARIISPSNKTDLYDMDGNKLYTIRNKIFPIIKNCTYIFDASGEKKKLLCKFTAKRGKIFKASKCAYPISLNGSLDEGITVNFDGQEVAYFEEFETDEKAFNKNSYELEIYDDIDRQDLSVAFLSAIVIGIDGLMLKLNYKK